MELLDVIESSKITNIEIVIISVFGPIILAGILAGIKLFFDFNSFAKQTGDHFERVEKHLENNDRRLINLESQFNTIEMLLNELKQGQSNHNARDAEFFTMIDKKLDKIDHNFEELWKGNK